MRAAGAHWHGVGHQHDHAFTEVVTSIGVLGAALAARTHAAFAAATPLTRGVKAARDAGFMSRVLAGDTAQATANLPPGLRAALISAVHASFADGIAAALCVAGLLAAAAAAGARLLAGTAVLVRAGEARRTAREIPSPHSCCFPLSCAARSPRHPRGRFFERTTRQTMSHPNTELIERFYTAFQRRDAETMIACYADDVVFSDPAFGELHGDEVRDMWRMLVAGAQEFSLTFGSIEADDHKGSAHWEAGYLFSQTGRPVVNRIDARFVFRDGLIIEHRDSFDLWLWMRQAMGVRGTLLGWSPLVRRMLRAQARRGLTAYRHHHSRS